LTAFSENEDVAKTDLVKAIEINIKPLNFEEEK